MKKVKNYVHLNELIGMLNVDKNIIDDSLSEKIFWEHSYVSIINPYKDYLCLKLDDEHRIYPENLDFKEFKKMIAIDDFISTRLNTYIKCFEQALTAYLIVTLSEKMISKGNNLMKEIIN